MGKYISTKKQYFDEMKRGGFIPSEEANSLAETHNREKEYKPSEKCINMIKNAKELTDKKGNITLGKHPRLVKAMEDSGMRFKLPDWCPQHYKEGGYAPD
jgi:hypothetical protein